jgi:hypothetical protein
MKDEHTPPPWEAFCSGHGSNIEPSIAWIGYGTAHSNKEHKANARLISAAPDMLSALRKAKAWMDPGLCLYENISEHDMNVYYETMEAINNAIQKATQP